MWIVPECEIADLMTREAAFKLETEPLARLLEEASERSLDAMLCCFEPGPET